MTSVDLFYLDLDECTMKTNACPANSLCTNSKGSYSCSCKEGYREEGDKCVCKFCSHLAFYKSNGIIVIPRFIRLYKQIIYEVYLPYKPWYDHFILASSLVPDIFRAKD